ncbi:MAG: hypothetical protein HYV60_23390 [Planctomycetia bacterium]|nr:hypothetical protein [Planctomycetia bacterium]
MRLPVIVFEDHGWQNLLPLVYMRASFELTCGMDSLLHKVWRLRAVSRDATGNPAGQCTSADISLWCRPFIATVVNEQTRFPVNVAFQSAALLLNGRVRWRRLPDKDIGTEPWVGVDSRNNIVCVFADASLMKTLSPETLLDELSMRAALADVPRRDVSSCVNQIFDWPWQLIHANKSCLTDDWNWYATNEARGYESAAIDSPRRTSPVSHRTRAGVTQGSYLLDPSFIRIGARSQVKPCVVIDAEEGPVWIGDDVIIQPHSYIQGPVFIGNGSMLQAGTIIRDGTTIGPVCKVGGEIESSILHSFSNKQHDGFLGHSYIGSWVNIAADCINSDLKNTYGNVRVPINGCEVETGEQFVGMLMGDYSKAGINVSFPTGASIGFCSSVLAARSPKFVPSYCWIDGEFIDRYDEQRGLLLAKKVMKRRGKTMTEAEQAAFIEVRQQALTVERYDQQFVEFGTKRAEEEIIKRAAFTSR